MIYNSPFNTLQNNIALVYCLSMCSKRCWSGSSSSLCLALVLGCDDDDDGMWRFRLIGCMISIVSSSNLCLSSSSFISSSVLRHTAHL